MIKPYYEDPYAAPEEAIKLLERVVKNEMGTLEAQVQAAAALLQHQMAQESLDVVYQGIGKVFKSVDGVATAIDNFPVS